MPASGVTICLRGVSEEFRHYLVDQATLGAPDQARHQRRHYLAFVARAFGAAFGDDLTRLLDDLVAAHRRWQVGLQDAHLRRLLVHQVLAPGLAELLDAL